MYPNLNHNWYPKANFKNEWILHSSETEKGKPKGKVLPNQQVWLENCLQMWPFDKNTHKHQLPYNCHSKCGVPSGNKSLPLWWSCTPVFNWLCECVTAERHTRWNCTYWDLELGRYTQPRLFLGGVGRDWGLADTLNGTFVFCVYFPAWVCFTCCVQVGLFICYIYSSCDWSLVSVYRCQASDVWLGYLATRSLSCHLLLCVSHKLVTTCRECVCACTKVKLILFTFAVFI